MFNASSVARARLTGRRAGSGGRVEGLFLSELHDRRWLVMLRSNGRLRVGDRIELLHPPGELTGVTLALADRAVDGGEWIVLVDPGCASGSAPALLERIGRTPLPPYIIRARGRRTDIGDEMDRKWYETVYADSSPDSRKSVAAPTAGLHFTPELLARLDESGIRRLRVTLHVGAGTFKPVTAPTLAQHRMHREEYAVPPETVAFLRDRQEASGERSSGRLIAIGTTSVRTLESLPELLPDAVEPITGSTDLLIAPPYTFRHVDGMLTNFHLPRSTLLALVGAMIGLERLKDIYAAAIEQEYRFYSYGDCMLILP